MLYLGPSWTRGACSWGKMRKRLEFFLSVRALLKTLIKLTLVLCEAPAFVVLFFCFFFFKEGGRCVLNRSLQEK